MNLSTVFTLSKEWLRQSPLDTPSPLPPSFPVYPLTLVSLQCSDHPCPWNRPCCSSPARSSEPPALLFL